MLNKISAEEFYDNYAIKYYDDVVFKGKCNAQHLNEAFKIFH
ncbi:MULTISPECIES: hypothetical protein [unclassified Okeania]|nr:MULTISPECIES: hypothetical protein [unclassified Okeania]